MNTGDSAAVIRKQRTKRMFFFCTYLVNTKILQGHPTTFRELYFSLLEEAGLVAIYVFVLGIQVNRPEMELYNETLIFGCC